MAAPHTAWEAGWSLTLLLPTWEKSQAEEGPRQSLYACYLMSKSSLDPLAYGAGAQAPARHFLHRQVAKGIIQKRDVLFVHLADITP